MADQVLYVLIRSWHRVGHSGLTTLCGRDFSPLVNVIRPAFGIERTCESCLRIAARRGL